ncbi:hypothetical protein Bca4012_021027 [Brassica carinata]
MDRRGKENREEDHSPKRNKDKKLKDCIFVYANGQEKKQSKRHLELLLEKQWQLVPLLLLVYR